ncbi:RlpA-like double-psi beta-barrel domain-containing protein [Nocardia colli]|uniref:RlpA-like double-psi beta-barrel domain-containing protein n=1 Tax=Nocardia colli TaxID=2545717 RepID=UPI0035D8762C
MTAQRSLALGIFTLATTIGSMVVMAPAADAQTRQGSATWTNFDGGACGLAASNSSMAAGVSIGLFGTGALCTKQLLVTSNSGKTVKVSVVDKCMGCSDNDLQLTPAAFQALGYPLGMGRAPITWSIMQ